MTQIRNLEHELMEDKNGKGVYDAIPRTTYKSFSISPYIDMLLALIESARRGGACL